MMRPDGDALRVFWSHNPEADRADTIISTGFPPCRVYVTACDPKGNCTPAYLDMRLTREDVPPNTGPDIYCPASPDNDGAEAFPRAR